MGKEINKMVAKVKFALGRIEIKISVGLAKRGYKKNYRAKR